MPKGIHFELHTTGAQRLAERRTMMQTWADYIDGLKAGLNPAFGQDGKEPRS
jgi:hypothetical protein